MNPDRYGDHGPRRLSQEERDRRRQRKKSYRDSRRQEERLAEKMGGRRVSGSGAGRAETRPVRHGAARAGGEMGRGDVETAPLLIEAKSTGAATMSIKMAWFEKIHAEATAVRKAPALAITFTRRSEWPGFPEDWIAVPAEWLREVAKRAGLADLP